jgi:flagellar secretion chaperone FliS
MNTTNALKAYKNVGAETSVASADPHELILLLYQGALLAIASAKIQMSRNEIAAKGKSISHAIAIIESGLQASLKKEVGGELAQNFFDLYTYMTKRLITANLKNDPAILDEVSGLLLELRTAWESIRPATPSSDARPQPEREKRQATLTYGRM